MIDVIFVSPVLEFPPAGGPQLKINNTIVVTENAIEEVNDEISKVLVKIDKNLTVTNEEILELKKKVYTLLEIEEDPLIVSLDDILPIQ